MTFRRGLGSSWCLDQDSTGSDRAELEEEEEDEEESHQGLMTSLLWTLDRLLLPPSLGLDWFFQSLDWIL